MTFAVDNRPDQMLICEIPELKTLLANLIKFQTQRSPKGCWFSQKGGQKSENYSRQSGTRITEKQETGASLLEFSEVLNSNINQHSSSTFSKLFYSTSGLFSKRSGSVKIGISIPFYQSIFKYGSESRVMHIILYNNITAKIYLTIPNVPNYIKNQVIYNLQFLYCISAKLLNALKSQPFTYAFHVFQVKLVP